MAGQQRRGCEGATPALDSIFTSARLLQEVALQMALDSDSDPTQQEPGSCITGEDKGITNHNRLFVLTGMFVRTASSNIHCGVQDIVKRAIKIILGSTYITYKTVLATRHLTLYADNYAANLKQFGSRLVSTVTSP
ncbi:hypothetical protein E2C01_070588 [Portunus trituberculatus]|uniref:Uncharacterized protein n=1 Tax=Portunus trituberculatus TaxID=210409 RepID=A0A5B7HXP4_PORTR|nr:hypothetical protein [Portunus trituberculatus]